jgi:hypothetical protein
MIRRTLALSAAALPLLTLLTPSAATAQAEDTTQATTGTALARASVVSSVADPRRDFTFTRQGRDLSYKVAGASDLRNFTASYGLRGNSDAFAFRFTVNKVTPGKFQQVYAASVASGGVTTTVAYNRSTNKVSVDRGGKPVTCPSAAASFGARTVAIAAPRSCFGRGPKVQVRGRTSILSGGKTLAFDLSPVSAPRTVNSKALRTWTLNETRGDVTFPGDPSAGGYVGESIDLTAARYASTRHGVSFTVGVQDPSYFSWDPKQRFYVDWISADGGVLGSLTVAPNRTEDGTMTVSGAGRWESCSRVAVFTVAHDVGFSGMVPKSCMSGSLVSFRIRSESLTEADVVTGSDVTANSQPVLLG